MERLLDAQQALQREKPQHRFLIFDGLRPQAVQVYMRQFDHERILPNYYSGQSDLAAAEIRANRDLLNRVMSGAGFHRITHEWWHFSYGDQMWALLESVKTDRDTLAIYGEVKSAT